MQKIKFLILLLFSTALLWSCTSHENPEEPKVLPLSVDTLKVALLKNSISCFENEKDTLGYDFELVQQFSEYSGIPVNYTLVNTFSEAVNMLDEKSVHLFASQIFQTKELNEKFVFILPQSETSMVLVQNSGKKAIDDLSELKGKVVAVVDNSIYYKRLIALNEEIGGGIEIKLMDDTCTIENLVCKVAKNELEYTLAHRSLVASYKNHYPNLDSRLNVTFKQKNGWLVSSDSEELIQKLKEWELTSEYAEISEYFKIKYNRLLPFIPYLNLKVPKGAVSPFDAVFKKYADEINWDWRLLASIAFHESGFDPTRVSRVGAAGLMQLMPSTAAGFGLNSHTIFNAERNIEAGVQYIKSLNLLFRNVISAEDRLKFVLASYNSGPAHIIDAMSLAEKFGKNKYKWTDNVEYYFQRSDQPEYYKDAVVKSGKYKSKQTMEYIRKVLETHHKFIAQSPMPKKKK